ncbi:MAG: ribonuclease P protein component [Pseudomonadota bacterium]|nr:ribonuclease P protein component [Pseudomonadota bacterium]
MSCRLLTPAHYRAVFDATAVRVGTKNALMLGRLNGQQPARLGLIAARRQLPRAVDRNRFKRMVRETFRVHRGELHGLDIVVLARSGFRSTTKPEQHPRLEHQWQRLIAEHRSLSD